MTGKTIVVTGASSGVGKATARELALLGAHVVMICRGGPKADATLKELQKAVGDDRVEMLTGDLSSQTSIREIAAKFLETHDRLDVLVNNAGMIFPGREVTFDGLERTFALNHLGYFLLTELLLDVLKRSAPSRIVNVASEAHRMVKGIDFDDLQAAKAYHPWHVYGQSKLANILFTRELSRRLDGTGVTANSLHPGFVNSGFARDLAGFQKFALNILRPFAMISPQQGARTPVYLASSPQVEGLSGRYYNKRRPASPSPAARDDAAARRLWEVSVDLTRPVS
jgi:NAD(P)-dependent dehydrogenase (short-subunit alcohol dehydrogenase family)